MHHRLSVHVLALALFAALAGAPMVVRAAGEGASAQVREAAAPAPAGVPFRRGPLLPGATLLRVAAVTAGGVGLVWLAALALRRRVQGAAPRAGRRIRVLETQRLTGRTNLLLVRLGDRELLLGETGNHLVLLRDAEASAGRVRPEAPSERAAAVPRIHG